MLGAKGIQLKSDWYPIKFNILFNVRKHGAAVCRMNYKKFQARLLFGSCKLF